MIWQMKMAVESMGLWPRLAREVLEYEDRKRIAAVNSKEISFIVLPVSAAFIAYNLDCLRVN